MTELHYGYTPDPEATARYVAALEHPVFRVAAHRLLSEDPKEDVLLYIPLLACSPGWNRKTPQGIGDCMGWGCAGTVDTTTAADIRIRKERERFLAPVCTEGMYGLMRVEANGGKPDHGGDGSYGSAAAKAVTKHGTVHRIKYSDEHDFTLYSAKRAKSFGKWGLPDALEPEARRHTVVTASLVTDFESAAAAIRNGYAVCNAHGRNPTASKRDRDGFETNARGFPHAMFYIGVRWGKRPGLLNVNSHGNNVTGPRWPEAMPDAIAGCSYWLDADKVDKVCRGGDTFAYSGYNGFPKQSPDFDMF